ncbi:predicted protein [Histoplasma mississippiense (nom. inval.)]|nr:predicted protein [Histoplasma mississippiense (nom. inval.)]EDN02161.1 predicted protein [Histoplasma mississippiense (nom. inval.)]
MAKVFVGLGYSIGGRLDYFSISSMYPRVMERDAQRQ